MISRKKSHPILVGSRVWFCTGETGRLLQIFHASIPVAEGEEMKKQPRHLVGIQDNGSLGLINRNNQNIQNYFLRVTPTN